MKLFLYDVYRSGELEAHMAVTLMVPALCQWSGVPPGGEHGGFWEGNTYGGDDYSGPAWKDTTFIRKTVDLRYLCRQYCAQCKTVKESTLPRIVMLFTQTGWRGDQIPPEVGKFLLHRTAIILLLGANYEHPPNEVPGSHDINAMASWEGGDADGSGDYHKESITGEKRKVKSTRKTRCSVHKIDEGSLTRSV
ncbi:hypothetical protein [Marinobacter alexandrii]|uniref:hypothetical protein n=1 Tax=Marinobacter alexandrii TaxID=2570351 RepID=UPI00329905B0